MEVFAEHIVEDNVEYRRKTLLKFGETEKLIGSAILINPGSSVPIGEANTEFVRRFYNALEVDTDLNLQNWKAFKVDSTMRQLERIFNGWYVQDARPLDGVIQLFNCYYYRNQNLNEAIENFMESSKYVFNEYDYLKTKPVYFGWGNQGKFGAFENIARSIFAKCDFACSSVYDQKFLENCFYHPGYVNRSYKTNKKTIALLKAFSKYM